MKITYAPFFLISFLCFGLPITKAQPLQESNLPIVIIQTNDQEIPDEPKIDAKMGIIYNGPGAINRWTDPWSHYDGAIAIETRGNSTQQFEKKTYSLETRDASNEDLEVSLLGMGAEEDWILHAMVIDKSQLRIPYSFHLFQQMGHYAANWRYVEVVLNDEYRGLYILTEKIKRDKNRVAIAKLDADDIAGDSLSGGYILRLDWLENEEEEYFLKSQFNAQGGEALKYQWYYPKANKIKAEQKEYLRNYIHDFESAVFSPDYSNASGIPYSEYIDLQSFMDFILINEWSKNADGYKLSSYLHKERESRGGKLRAGPIWDFD